MKNKLLGIFGLALLFGSCDKNEVFTQEEAPYNASIYGTLQPQTRTVLDSLSVKWNYNDSIGVFVGFDKNTPFRNIIPGESLTAEFRGHSAWEGRICFAYYPYQEGALLNDNGQIEMTLPKTQQFAGNHTFGQKAYPTVGMGVLNKEICFANVCGIVKVQLYGSMHVSSISLVSDEQPVCGRTLVSTTYFGEEVSSEFVGDPADNSNKRVTLTGINQLQGNDVKSYYLAIPPATYNGLTIVVTDSDGVSKEQRITRPVTVSQSGVTSLEPFEVKGYKSFFYYSYATESLMDAVTFGLDASEFEPGEVAQYGSRLYIANKKANAQSVIVFDTDTKQVVDVIRSWTYNGKEYTFPNESIDALYAAEGKLYVASRSNRIEVFDTDTHEYITRIGNGNWGETTYQIHHTFAIMQQDSLLFVREKNRMVTYKVSDIKPGSFQRVPAFQRTNFEYYDVNNSYNSYQMIADKGSFFITNYGGAKENKILCINPALVEPGKQTTWIEPARNLALNFNPIGIAAHTNRFMILQPNGRINVYDRDKGEVVRDFNSIAGATFNRVHKIYIHGDQIRIVDAGAKRIYEIGIHVNEIREYDILTRSTNSTILRVRTKEGREILVDTETHEIVEEL